MCLVNVYQCQRETQTCLHPEAGLGQLEAGGDDAPPDQVAGEGREGVEEERGHLGEVVEDEGVLPHDHGGHQTAQAQRVVGQEPGGVGGGEVELRQHREVDPVAEVQHEQLTLVPAVLQVPASRQSCQRNIAKIEFLQKDNLS